MPLHVTAKEERERKIILCAGRAVLVGRIRSSRCTNTIVEFASNQTVFAANTVFWQMLIIKRFPVANLLHVKIIEHKLTYAENNFHSEV